MRSSEIAELAGVTVRTLRHYHALGLLPEPPRRENGYREYGAVDLVRLLRIKRLASLGFSLEQIGEMLDDGPDASLVQTGEDELDALDRELADRIERLRQQRAVIAELKAVGSTADISVRHGRFLAEVARHTDNARFVQLERDTFILAESVLPSEADEFLAAYHDELVSRNLVGRYVEMNERYMALDEKTPLEELRAVVDGFADFVTPVIIGLLLEFPAISTIDFDDKIVDVMLNFDKATLNDAQSYVSDETDRVISERIVEEARRDADLARVAAGFLDPDVTS